MTSDLKTWGQKEVAQHFSSTRRKVSPQYSVFAKVSFKKEGKIKTFSDEES